MNSHRGTRRDVYLSCGPTCGPGSGEELLGGPGSVERDTNGGGHTSLRTIKPRARPTSRLYHRIGVKGQRKA